MKNVHLITVGSLKEKNLQVLEDNYSKQIKSFKLLVHEVKSLSEDKEAEAKLVFKKIDQIKSSGRPFIVLLAENGKQMDSLGFSKWIFQHLESSLKEIILVIGGAAGFGKELLSGSNEKISLSPLTFPHKIARLLLIEQLYRAQTIKQGHPYHK